MFDKCAAVGAFLKLFSLFLEFFFGKVCQFRKKLYLCTRFREATTVAVLIKQDDP